MKRTIIKLTILIAVVAVIVTCIIVWKESKLKAPSGLTYVNEHVEDLKNTIDKISPSSLEDYYQSCVYKLRRYEKEKLVDNDNLKQFQKDFLDKYVPEFISQSNKCFKNKKWDMKPWNHKFMRERITELRYRDERYYSNKYKKELNGIENIIDRYDAAKELLGKKYFDGINKTKEREKLAKQYKNDTVLKNCESLVNDLNELPGKIKKSHLKFLGNKADEIVCDSLYDLEEYGKDIKNLYRVRVAEYDKHYNNTSDTKEIKEKILKKELDYLSEFTKYVNDISNFNDYNYQRYNETRHYVNDYMSEKSLNGYNNDSIKRWVKDIENKSLDSLSYLDSLNHMQIKSKFDNPKFN